MTPQPSHLTLRRHQSLNLHPESIPNMCLLTSYRTAIGETFTEILLLHSSLGFTRQHKQLSGSELLLHHNLRAFKRSKCSISHPRI